MGKYVDLTGQKFGRLTVIERVGTDKHGGSLWLCRCDCGRGIEKITTQNHLQSGDCKSCGCLHEENAIKVAKLAKHGGCGTRLYRIYYNMLGRCYNSNVPSYKNYGARGITVCDEWKEDFKKFREWSIKNGYNENLTIDRIDVNGNYEPSNCRWATKSEQSKNTTKTHYLTYRGETKSMKQLADDHGISYKKLKDRINKLHWNTERALNTP